MIPVLRALAAGNLGRLLLGLALAAATVLAGIGLLGLSGWFITATGIAGLSAATAYAFDVFAPAAGIRLLAILRTGARYGERVSTHDATLGALANLRERLFRGWSAPGPAAGLLLRPSRVLFRLTLDVDALDALYLRGIVPAATLFAAVLAFALALGLMDPSAGIAAAAFLLATGLGVPLLAARAARKPARRRARLLETYRAGAADATRGQTELLMAGRLDPARARLAEAEARLAEADIALDRVDRWTGAALSLAGGALLAGTLVVVAGLARAGAVSAPVAALGVLAAMAATEPFAAARRGAMEFGRARLAAARLAPRLAEPTRAAPAPAPEAPFAAVLTAASIRHPGAAAPVLRDVDLTVAPGERIAVVGPSGGGKSSLLALLAGDLVPDAGGARAVPATLLTQRAELFRDSLRDNLRLADPAADDARLRAALAAAGLGPFVAALPRGLDTRLGEGGQGLSGGQARRLALARAILRGGALWLLDEPTEGLDAATAADVLDRALAAADGRAIVIATHERRVAERADRLIVLGAGGVRAEARRGTPEFDRWLDALRAGRRPILSQSVAE